MSAKPQTLPPPKSIPELIEGLKVLTADIKSDLPELKLPVAILRKEVIDLMNSYAGDDWHQYEFWDETCYTRNRIYIDPEERFELILLCWNISQLTPIHNHPESQCFFKLLQGEMVERQYAMPNPNKKKRMKVIETNMLNKTGNTGWIDDGVGVHMVENVSPSQKCVTLHLYAPAYKTVNSFDEATGKVHTHGCDNYSIAGVKCENHMI